MSDSNKYQPMIIPKGAKIITENKGEISIDVQGDLILQENQKGLTSMTSHHGSILIDEGVQVHANKVDSRHMIRVKGSLTIDDLTAAEVTVDGGTLRCSTVESNKVDARNANLNIKSIKASEVTVKGGLVEIGTINAKALTMKDSVKGSVLIANADKRNVEDTVHLKGGFESDIELLGYLMKYREQVLSEKVVQKLKESEASELRQVLLEAKDESEDVIDVDAVTSFDGLDDSGSEENVFETSEFDSDDVVSDLDDTVDFDTMQKWAERLEAESKDGKSTSAVIKLIITGLKQGDKDTLQTIFTRWKNNVEEEKKSVSEEMKMTLAEIENRITL